MLLWNHRVIKTLLFVAYSTSHSIGLHSKDFALCMEIHKDQGLRKLQSRITSVFEFVAKDADVGQILKDIKHILEDAHDTSIQDSIVVTPHDVPPSDIPCDKKDNSEDAGSVAEKELISSQEPTQYIQITSDVEAAISQSHDFILFLDRETMALHSNRIIFAIHTETKSEREIREEVQGETKEKRTIGQCYLRFRRQQFQVSIGASPISNFKLLLLFISAHDFCLSSLKFENEAAPLWNKRSCRLKLEQRRSEAEHIVAIRSSRREEEKFVLCFL
ncbi:unnamed protein product [Vicia faba]|uniref:Uncharacterized protein n=1 Tax=Vicia faba TaxID=3906 RepID=A0AAV1AZP8_VICFA|nr:unnamed protein product [Vicia faba]